MFSNNQDLVNFNVGSSSSFLLNWGVFKIIHLRFCAITVNFYNITWPLVLKIKSIKPCGFLLGRQLLVHGLERNFKWSKNDCNWITTVIEWTKLKLKLNYNQNCVANVTDLQLLMNSITVTSFCYHNSIIVTMRFCCCA